MDDIDPEWLDRVHKELVHPALPPAWVAAAEFVPSARVAAYLPVLIRRRAQHRLSGSPVGGLGRRPLAR